MMDLAVNAFLKAHVFHVFFYTIYQISLPHTRYVLDIIYYIQALIDRSKKSLRPKLIVHPTNQTNSPSNQPQNFDAKKTSKPTNKHIPNPTVRVFFDSCFCLVSEVGHLSYFPCVKNRCKMSLEFVALVKNPDSNRGPGSLEDHPGLVRIYPVI